MERKTKIIATIGPATASEAAIEELIEAGMNVARLNFSHGDSEVHRRVYGWVREASDRMRRPVAVMQDIQGPKLRVGTFPDGEVTLEAGSTVMLRPGEGEGTADEVYVHYLKDVDLAPGAPILLADGLIHLTVEEVGETGVRATIREGGVLGSRKGVAFPGSSMDIPPITEKDRSDLELGKELGVDMVAASFVSSGAHIEEVRSLIAPGVCIVAKIESALAYRNLDDILASADAVMVARGDLGIDVSFDTMPRIQKDIIARTNAYGRISITATEMLESMTSAPRATRAEVTDVANAVLDGTDAVMLSAETAIGSYPDRAVRTMSRICIEAEKSPDYGRPPEAEFLEDISRFASAIAQSAVAAADSLGLRAVVAFTESGSTARLLSKYRPRARVYGFTPNMGAYNRMAIYSGVTPMMLERVSSTDDMILASETTLLERQILEEGEGAVIVAGVPPNQEASTNLMKLHVLGEAATGMPH
ncbi:MAG: pyruvate kinase [Acidimicrobiia bacterium]|nr:pyruvate kinase [Acidimicrobiia bacterium]MBT8214723.1 pyruvate kinase [Acidimicrobiia bacterium]NNF69730.1 pyruvate kinase [Acidimicrobiia bacterium]NNK91567.1 pyruvate kinase [Acidimicrobiia bacterium]